MATFDCDAVWQTAQGALRRRLGEVRTMRWLPAITLVALDRARGRATFRTDSAQARKLAQPHVSAIAEAIERATGLADLDVRFSGRTERDYEASSKAAPRERAARAARLDGDSGIGLAELVPPPPEVHVDPLAPDEASESGVLDLDAGRWNGSLTLDSFLVGPANEIAHDFARSVVEQPGGFMNPIFFHGGPGCGKSHLLNGIATAYSRRHPGRRVAFASSERFATQFSLSVRRRQGAQFREVYRGADLVIVDDVHLLAGRSATEQELLHTIDQVVRHRGQVVAASVLAPKQIARLDRGLLGRLIQGVVVEVREPDETTRARIVRARAAASKLGIPDEVVALVAREATGSAGDLLAAVQRLEAHARLLGTPIDLKTAREILGDYLRARADAPTPDSIVALVAQELGVDPKAVRGGGRKLSVVRARQVAMSLVRTLTTLTLREIGAHFGDRSPACVHFAQSRVRHLKEEDPKIKAIVDAAYRRFRREAFRPTPGPV